MTARTPASTNPEFVNDPGLEDRIISVNDGKVRIVAMLEGSNVEGMFGLQRLQQRLGKVAQVVAMPSLSGSWGTTLIEANDEANRLRKTYDDKIKPIFPIGFWVVPKQQENRWTGMLLPKPPSHVAYRKSGRMVAYVIDGTGHIRHIERWRGRDSEQHVAAFVERLLTQ
jgi:hypothetical protein